MHELNSLNGILFFHIEMLQYKKILLKREHCCLSLYTFFLFYFIWEKCKSGADERKKILSHIFFVRKYMYKDIIIACRREISLKNSLLCLFIQVEISLKQDEGTKKRTNEWREKILQIPFSSSLFGVFFGYFFLLLFSVKWSWHLYAWSKWRNQTLPWIHTKTYCLMNKLDLFHWYCCCCLVRHTQSGRAVKMNKRKKMKIKFDELELLLLLAVQLVMR